MRRAACIAAMILCAVSLADDGALVPRPAGAVEVSGAFPLDQNSFIQYSDTTGQVAPVAEYLADQLKAAVKIRPPVRGNETSSGSGATTISLSLQDHNPSWGKETYSLEITPQSVALRAATAEGLFRGVQTIRQLVRSDAGATPAISCVKQFADQPRYPHRGMLLDCGRHFMDKDFVKRYIDLLAYHKMNVLHWHLTEDQGWRIEIKKYPKLTEVGAWRKATRDDEQPRDAQGRYGGFYSQEDVKEIVAYAKSRFVTVIPEIELPGHCRAALASYPEYSCTGGPFEVGTEWGVEPDVYCAGNDKTFDFLQDVLAEVIDLFPSEFIHIGGDECPKDRWQKCPKCQARMKAEGLKDEHELQSYFIRRIEKFLNGKGRRLVGWDEILEGGLAPNATVQSWRGMEGAIAAAQAGHDVISSPTSHCYLDYPQGPNANLPGWMGFVDLAKAYSFEPTPASLTVEQAKHVLGAEGNIWTERAPQSRVDWQVFPRLCALAEVTWSPAEGRDWKDFQRRMKTHYKRLDAMGVTYYVPIPEIGGPSGGFAETTTVDIACAADEAAIHYTLNGSDPTAQSPKFEKPIALSATTTVKARTILANERQSDVAVREVRKLVAHEAVNVSDVEPGVLYRDYLGMFTKVPDVATLMEMKVGTTPAIGLDAIPRADGFCRAFEGFISAPADGLYTFFVTSDDGSLLRMGNELVVSNDGPHPPTEMSGTVLLKKGLQPFALHYCEIGGDQTVSVAWSGPGFEKKVLDASALSHSAGREKELRSAFDASGPRGPETVQPTPRTDDWWTARHAELCKRGDQKGVKLMLIGDSITQGWENEGKDVWAKFYTPRCAINLGIGGDRTQHVLWRLRNGNIAGFIKSPEDAPQAAVLMIGTNNSNGNDNTAEEIGAGIEAIVKELRSKLPNTKVLILAIFPRGEKPNAQREKNAKASEIASKLADGKMVHFMDIGAKFLEDDGTLTRDIMPDLLHLSPRGYEIWAEAIEGKVKEMVGE